jgi:serine/threonine-protein kinase
MASPAFGRNRAHSKVGTVLNEKWRLDALLGIGGMAAVYAATHRNGKRAALKILHTELIADDTLVARFLREGYLANKVDHPGVVSVLDDARADDGSCYLVMELLDGYSLERHTQGSPMPLPDVLRITDELLDVLAAAHATGIVHRDIKPANLFLTREGKLKVLDFGIARLAEPLGDGQFTQTGAAIGTPSYMPPEQARGRWNEVDARTDLWAVGATMIALLIGHRPRRAETMQEELLVAMTEPVAPAATLAPFLSPSLTVVIDTALSFDREKRFRDARAMQLELRRALDAGGAELLQNTLVVAAPAADTARVVHPGIVAPQQSPSWSSTQHTPAPQSGQFVPQAHSSGGPIEMPEPHLTTGRPMWVAPPRSPTPTSGKLVLVAVATALLLTSVGGGAVLWTRHRASAESEAHKVAPRAVAGGSAVATAAAVATASAIASSTPPTIAPAGGATAGGATANASAGGEGAPAASGLASATTVPSATTAPSAALGAGRVAPPRASASPRSSAAPADTSDFFNRRF